MDATILAAGEGSRLGDETNELPKLFLEVSGKTIYERQLEALKPILDEDLVDDEITIVLGHGFDDESNGQYEVENFVAADPSFRYNPVILSEWESVENAASALAAVESMNTNDHILLLCGDIIPSKALLQEFVTDFVQSYASEGYSAVGAFEGHQNEMTAVAWNENRKITEYGKIRGHQEAGIFVLHKDHISAAKEIWQENVNSWFPIVFPEVPSKPIMLNQDDHVEINTSEHLERARDIVPFHE